MDQLTSFISENCEFSAAKYLAVLAEKEIGGFLLAVLINKTFSNLISGLLQGISTFCRKTRFYILSLIPEYCFYGY